MALAFVNEKHSKYAAASTSLTWAHDTTNVDFLVVNASCSLTGSPTLSATYNGVAMTKHPDAPKYNSGTGTQYMFYAFIASGDRGNNNIVVSCSGTKNIYGNSAGYSGVVEFDTSGYLLDEVGNTTFNISLTSVKDRCWHIACIDNENTEPTAGTRTTRRTSGGDAKSIMDSNSIKSPAGSVTLQATTGSSTKWNGFIISVTDTSSGVTMQAGTGAFTLTGNSINLKANARLSANTGTFTLTGMAVNFARGYTMIASPGSYTIIGIPVTFRGRGDLTWSRQSKNSTSWSNQSKN